MMLQRWYQSLTDREKLLLAAGCSTTVALLLVLLFWRPLSADNQQLERIIQQKSVQLGLMQQSVEQIVQLRQQSDGGAAEGSLQHRVTRSASALKIGLTRLQSSSEQTLQLWIDRVEFNNLIRLIDQLSKQGVALDKLHLQPLPENGYSKAKLTLLAR